MYGRMVGMVKGKHHCLCNVVDEEFKKCLYHNKPFFSSFFSEDHYFMQKLKNGMPIEGECDYAALRFGKKKYGVFVEVKSSNSGKNRRMAIKQLNKDVIYYSQLYELDRVFCLYAYGDPKDKGWVSVSYELIKGFKR